MLPLAMADAGTTNEIKRVAGDGSQRQFIEGLGFVQGAEVTVLSKTDETMIVNVKGSRVAINKDVALKIMI